MSIFVVLALVGCGMSKQVALDDAYAPAGDEVPVEDRVMSGDDHSHAALTEGAQDREAIDGRALFYAVRPRPFAPGSACLGVRFLECALLLPLRPLHAQRDPRDP